MDVHPEFYNPYLEKIPSENVVHSLKENMNACLSIFETMSEEKSGYRYAEGSATIQLFESFDEEQFAAIGTMSGNRTSVHSLARIIAGHCKHHLGVIEERYF